MNSLDLIRLFLKNRNAPLLDCHQHHPTIVRMIDELRKFQAATVSFTRLPFASEKLEASHFQLAHYYLPVIGLIIGLLTAAVFHVSAIYFTSFTSAVLAILTGVLLTGAIHEDGFADCCDGFGAGGGADKIQTIMKDSQLGSYGVLGLIGLLSLKIVFLNEVIAERQVFALVLMHCLARVSPLLIMATLQRTVSKTSKMTANLHENSNMLAIILIIITAGVLITAPLPLGFALIAAVLLISLCCKHYFDHKLKGYNGDCLGASEQITECCILAVFALYY